MLDEATSINLDEHLARGGPAAQSFARLWRQLWAQDHIPPELLELCRLTFARLHGDEVEMRTVNTFIENGGPKAALRQLVRDDRALYDPTLPAGWRPVLLFAEYYWTDAQSIPDDVADAVKDHHGEAGLVLLIEALGCIDGRIRSARCLRDLSDFRAAQEFAHVE